MPASQDNDNVPDKKEAYSGVSSESTLLLDEHEIHAEPCRRVVGWRVIVEQNNEVTISVHAQDRADRTIDIAHAIADLESLPNGSQTEIVTANNAIDVITVHATNVANLASCSGGTSSANWTSRLEDVVDTDSAKASLVCGANSALRSSSTLEVTTANDARGTISVLANHAGIHASSSGSTSSAD